MNLLIIDDEIEIINGIMAGVRWENLCFQTEMCIRDRDKTHDRETVLNEGDFVIIPPEMNQAVFTGEEDAVTVNIILKRSTFGDSFYSLLLEICV